MSKNELGEDSPSSKSIHLKIRCRDSVESLRQDSVESLTTLEEGEFKVPIDGCISIMLLYISIRPMNTWINKFY